MSTLTRQRERLHETLARRTGMTIDENESRFDRIRDAVESGHLISNEDTLFLLDRITVLEASRNILVGRIRNEGY
jgi:hypothetical protein